MIDSVMSNRIKQFNSIGILSLSLLCGVVTNGQDIKRITYKPYSDSVQISSINFDRILDTYIWTGLLQKQINTQIMETNFRQSVRSRFIKTNMPAIQDEYNGLISFKYRLSEKWKIEFHNNSNILSDNRAIGLGRMAQHQFLSGFKNYTLDSVDIGMFMGYELNSQDDEKDHGFIYSLGFDARDLRMEDFDIKLNSSWNKSMLGRRSPHSGQINFSLSRDFGGGVFHSIILNYSMQKREFYTSLAPSRQSILGAKHNIFSRNANVIDVMNKFIYQSHDNFIFSTSLGFANQVIDRAYRYRDSALILDSEIQEMQFYVNASFQLFLFDWLTTIAKITVSEKDEKHSVIDKMENPTPFDLQRINEQRASANRLENTAHRTGASIEIITDVAKNNKIKLYASANILRYDTPDISNTDDRDELFMTYGFEVSHRFSKYLNSSFTVDATLYHLVYINKEQSANNNWNRVLRLSPIVEYKPVKWLRTVARAEVLANYTISDYEQQIASVKSYSFRQAYWMDSTMILMTKNIQFKFFGSLRIFERGILKWKEFSERPESYFVEKTVWPELIWTSDIGIRIGLGYRYFGQDRYKYQLGKRNFAHNIQTTGPTALLEWQGPNNERFSMIGWLENQKNNDVKTRTISNLSIQVGFVL